MEVIRPSLNGYSDGCRRATRAWACSSCGRVPRRHQAHGGDGLLHRRVEGPPDPVELAAPRYPREAANPDGHRVDRPAAERCDQLVADLLEGEPLLHDRPVVDSHRERGRVAQVVRSVQQVDMQGVALDPFAAVQESPEGPHLRVHPDAEQALERMHRRHLVGDGADAADPGDDVDDLVPGAPDDEALEVARCLEDVQAGLCDLAATHGQAQASLALHAGDIGNPVVAVDTRGIGHDRGAVTREHRGHPPWRPGRSRARPRPGRARPASCRAGRHSPPPRCGRVLPSP